MNTIPEPVRPGTAEMLARLAHFAPLDIPEAGELLVVARFLIGKVGDTYEAPGEVWDSIREDCTRLWHLISDDWDDRDLDGPEHLSEDDRYDLTRNRLTVEIEHTIWLARYKAAEARRARYAFQASGR